jgi:hypothetical protein
MESTLPQDHVEQLQLGIKITHSAFQNKVASLEQEINGLRLTCEEQRDNVSKLQKKNSALEVELVESHQRSQQLAEENKELFKTVGNLRKQIGRLEHLKAAVMSSIQDDAEKVAEMGESRALMSDEYLRQAAPMTHQGLGFAGGVAPRAVSPMPQMGGGGQYMPMQSTAPSMAAGAPASPQIDGKAFFRQARGKLSHEAFNQFLASIKRLNNQQQTREETLDEARRLFGPEHQDLYTDFETLLSRQGV